MKLKVQVKPNSKQQAVEEASDGTLIVRLKSPPVDGKANAELIEVLSDRYGIPKSQIRIKSGAGAKHKLVELDGA